MVRNLKGSPRDVFSEIYRRNMWGYQETVSGGGSTLHYTERLRESLPGLLAELKIRTLLDVPCGDYHWLSQVDIGVDRYVGGDVVPDLIGDLQKRYGKSDRDFSVIDLCNDALPTADLLLCRDCMMHLAEDMVFSALANILRSTVQFVLLTNYPEGTNRSISTGDWFTINLCSPPYNLPQPERALDDWVPPYDRRQLALWSTDTLRQWANGGANPRIVYRPDHDVARLEGGGEVKQRAWRSAPARA
jgi:hypothetical protein